MVQYQIQGDTTDYQILVLDLDGMLANRDKIITPKTKMALIEPQKQERKVMLVSGRPTYGVLPLAKELELKVYGGCILSYNEDVIISYRTGETVFSCCTSVKYNAAIIRLAIDQRVNILTYEGDKIITLDGACPYVAKKLAINKLGVEVRAGVESYITFQMPKSLILDDGDCLAPVGAQVKAKLGKPSSIYRSEPYLPEIMSRGIDRTQSLGRLPGSIDLSREQMIACDDGYSDLTMIQYADLGVAMENAILPLEQAAGYMVLSNNDGGIAHAVGKFMFS